MVQRLSIALAQVKDLYLKTYIRFISDLYLKIYIRFISENVLSEIRQIIYSLYQAKEITKKLYNNITNSLKL